VLGENWECQGLEEDPREEEMCLMKCTLKNTGTSPELEELEEPDSEEEEAELQIER
jgi:hypothetical protein